MTLVLEPSGCRKIRHRTRRDPKPHFKPSRITQLDAIAGCPELQVASDHLARLVAAVCGELDTSALEARYSSLGRHGYHPKAVLAVWIYASLIGMHYATQVERAIKTDAAFRFLTGGYAMSVATLKRFRKEHGSFFEAAVIQTLQMAHSRGLLETQELAVDSMRLRAEASLRALRSRERSAQRLRELAAVDVTTMDDTARSKHDSKVTKHQQALRLCDESGATSVLVTNESAALMKFPHGGAQPGHRVTATVAGASERFFVAILVDASPTDHGKLGPAIEKAKDVLRRAGVDPATPLCFTADAGYWDQTCLSYAAASDERTRILVAEAPPAISGERKGLFGRDRFIRNQQGRLVCPAGRVMQRESKGRGKVCWSGVGCADCPLKPQCTKASRRQILIRTDYEAAAHRMRLSLAMSDAAARYSKRLATVEPAFASLEDGMGFRRASSRHAQTITAELLLKVLAHNVSRLIATRPLHCILVYATCTPRILSAPVCCDGAGARGAPV